jgi:transcriptional regulator with XRE-family HTH domain
LPFARVSLKSLILRPYDFVPISIGDHLRKKRLQLGLFKRDVGQRLGFSPWTIINWERGHTEPPISALPAILGFLGYDPFPESKTIQDHMLAKRRKNGWSVKEAAEIVGVDPGTWRNWERGQLILYRKHRALMARLLGLSTDAVDLDMAARWNRSHKR